MTARKLLIFVSICAFSLMLTPVARAQRHRAKGTPNLVGKKLPKIYARKWFTVDRFPLSRLDGQSWVLVLVPVKSPHFTALRKLLESIYRPPEKGGPCVIVLTKEGADDVTWSLRQMDKKPTFPIVGDMGYRTYLELGADAFPYFYIVGADGLVQWQGIADAELGNRLMRLRSSAERKGEDGTGSPGHAHEPLPADYRNQVEKALQGHDNRNLVRLLLLGYQGHRQPEDPLLKRVWKQLDEELAKGRKKAEEKLHAKDYPAARKLVLELNAELKGFPPASVLGKLWAELADKEGAVWYDHAVEAKQRGAKDEARADLERILRYYKGSRWEGKAKKLLAQLQGGGGT